MKGELPVCPASINESRKLHFKLKCLPRQILGRCLLGITLVFNRTVFLCNGKDITDHLLTLGHTVARRINVIHRSC